VRVVNLEGHNVGSLSRALIPHVVGLVTIDVSYTALAAAVPQLNVLTFAPGADLVALVKPTFELRRATVAADPADVAAATAVAGDAIGRAGWAVVDVCDAPRPGRRGARETFVHGRRR